MTASSSATWPYGYSAVLLQMSDNAKGGCRFTRHDEWRFGREKAELQLVSGGCQIGALVARSPAALFPNCRILALF